MKIEEIQVILYALIKYSSTQKRRKLIALKRVIKEPLKHQTSKQVIYYLRTPDIMLMSFNQEKALIKAYIHKQHSNFLLQKKDQGLRP
jgi:hypothetical protein